MNSYDYLIYIGRFQPLHFGHLFIVEKALSLSNQLIILLGSSQENRTAKNPWTIEERIKMFQSVLTKKDFENIHFLPIIDIPDDLLWQEQIQQKIKALLKHKSNLKIGLIGHNKDESSYYLKLFPQWDYLEIENYQNISATPLRKRFFAGETEINEIPKPVLNQLLEWKTLL